MEVDRTLRTPRTVLAAASIGEVTKASTASGELSGHWVTTESRGKLTSGVSSSGSSAAENSPVKTTASAAMATAVGRWMARRVSFIGIGN